MNLYAYNVPGAKSAEANKERFTAYKESGLTTLYLTGWLSYCLNGDEPWAGSSAQKCFELAKEVGIEKIIIRDQRLYEGLVDLKDNLIGKGKDFRFQTEDELLDYVRFCMKDYVKEPMLLGLGLHDEPDIGYVNSFGYVYRAIKKVAKEYGRDDFYIQMNLNPMILNAYFLMHPDYKNMTESQLYENYVDAFLESTGADIVCVDNYPFRPSNIGGRFLAGYYSSLQILNKVCKKHGARLAFVIQSFEMYHKTNITAQAGYRRIATVNEMFLQMNSVLGFGVRDVAFYTFETMNSEPESPYRTQDGSSFITEGCEKTHIFYFAQSAIEHAKSLEPVLFNYDYTGARILIHDSVKRCEKDYLASEGIFDGNKILEPTAPFDNTYEFKCVSNFSCDKDVLLITELEKNGDNTYIYMVLNAIDSPYKIDPSAMNVDVWLKPEFKSVNAFINGKWTEKELDNGKITWKLSQGEAVYFVPLKK
ncbi:MAG: hypothetical protein E7346_07240 [Clostridiales bacterium]|nr:hypothetical protein [Clostridiales bacterium]